MHIPTGKPGIFSVEEFCLPRDTFRFLKNTNDIASAARSPIEAITMPTVAPVPSGAVFALDRFEIDCEFAVEAGDLSVPSGCVLLIAGDGDEDNREAVDELVSKSVTVT